MDIDWIGNYIDGWNESRDKTLNYSGDAIETIAEESNEPKDRTK